MILISVPLHDAGTHVTPLGTRAVSNAILSLPMSKTRSILAVASTILVLSGSLRSSKGARVTGAPDSLNSAVVLTPAIAPFRSRDGTSSMVSITTVVVAVPV